MSTARIQFSAGNPAAGRLQLEVRNLAAEHTRRDGMRWTLPFVLLLGLAAALPLAVPLSLGPLDLVHLGVLAVVLTTAALRVAGGLLPWRGHASAIWLGLLLVIQLLSLMMARDQGSGVRSVATGAMGVLLALTVHSLCISPARWRRFITVLVGMGSFAAVYSLATVGVAQAQFVGGGALSGRAIGLFNQPNQLGTFSAVLLLIAWGLALGARNRAEFWLGTLCALLSAANLVLSFSRGAWIGAALGVVFLLALSARRLLRGQLRVAAISGLVAIPLIPLLAPQTLSLVTDRFASITQPGAGNPDDDRILIYEEAIRQIIQRPLLGQGPGNFETASAMAESVGGSLGALHAHNMVLQAGEAGLPAIAVLGVFAFSLGRRLWRARTELPQPDAALALGLGCAMLAVLGQGVVDFTLGHPSLLYLVWAVIGCLLAATDPRRRVGASPERLCP